MINISHLSKTFSGQKVLDDLSLDIQKGEVVALIGSSGAGKSTFLRSLNYLEQPDSGKITIDGFKVDFSRISKDEILLLRRKLAMVFQQFNLFSRRTALENGNLLKNMGNLYVITKVQKIGCQYKKLKNQKYNKI